jgi:hypothetical protein
MTNGSALLQTMDGGKPWDQWFRNKELGGDMGSWHFELWSQFLEEFRNKSVNILEIGSAQGQSAIFFLRYLPHSRIVCIDLFPGRKIFRRNLSEFGSRVAMMRGRSIIALDRLHNSHVFFDLIYVDGSHARDDVMLDSLMAWRLLKLGGVLIWDDYHWQSPPVLGPREAIDSFLAMHPNCLDVLHHGSQVIIRKTAELPAFYPVGPALTRDVRSLILFLSGNTTHSRTLENFYRFLMGRLH